MGVAVVIHVNKDIFEQAKANALREATTLPALIAQFVKEQAKKKTKEAESFIHESDAEKEIWCASRATLYSMRKSGELREDDHYIVREGSLIFYKKKVLRDFFKKNYPHIEQANLKKYIESEDRVGGAVEQFASTDQVGEQIFRVFDADALTRHLKETFKLVDEKNIRIVLDDLSLGDARAG